MSRNSETEYRNLIKAYMSIKKDAEICRSTGLKKSHICRIRKGERIPKEYDTLERIMDALKLTGQKRMKLTMAYQLERSPDMNMFYKSFKKLYMLQYPEKAYCTVQQSRRKNFKNAEHLSGDDLITAIKQLVKSANNEVVIIFTPLSDPASERMGTALNGIPDNVTIQCLMPFDDRSEGFEQFNIVANCFKILCCPKSCSITKYTCDLNEFVEKSTFPYPFCIMNDKEVIAFDKDISKGVYFTDMMFNLYVDRYKNIREYAKSPFIRSFDLHDNTMSALSGIGRDIAEITRKNCKYYVIGSTPCVILGMRESRTLRSIMANGIDRLQIPDHYIKLLKMISENSEKIIHFFSYDCFKHYLDDENFHEISSHISLNVPKEMRRKMSGNFFEENIGNKKVEFHGMKYSKFPISNPFTGMNMISTEGMGISIFFCDFHEKAMIIAINDKSITENFICLAEAMNKPGLMDSTEQTIGEVKKELEIRGIFLNNETEEDDTDVRFLQSRGRVSCR